MDKVLSKYKKMAYLSYQIILHFKHMFNYTNAIVLLLNIKHISDHKYQIIILTIPKDIEFSRASRPAFLHIFENLHNYHNYSDLPNTSKLSQKKVTFNEIVQVRNMLKCEDYYECLTN